MRIDQFLPSFAMYDAIGSHVRSIQNLLREKGFVSEIFTELTRGDTEQYTTQVSQYARHADPKNVIIYHHSIESEIPMRLLDVPGFVVTNYHNVTPFYFFDEKRDRLTYQACLYGVLQNELLKLRTNYFWHVSHFNARDFQNSGIPFDILPILRDFDALTVHAADPTVSTALKSPKKSILFVGRLAMHKCQHSMLGLLKLLHECHTKDVRLLLVGNGAPNYVSDLQALAADFELSSSYGPINNQVDVCIMPNLSDAELAAVYRLADIFLCLSDHEGFCVPLVEAMHFELPIVAHKSSAIAETCGTGGLLIDKTETKTLLDTMKKLLQDETLRNELKAKARARAQDFRFGELKSRFDKVLDNTLKLNNNFKTW
jgi:glycosyltransferase involved in cell wall biosynthesis